MIVPKASHSGPAPSRRKRGSPRIACLGTVIVALAGATAAADISRLPASERGPFTMLLGVPSGWTDLGGDRVELSWTVANHAFGAASGAEALLLDGETHTVTLRVQRRVNTRVSLGLEVPWVVTGGGFLDRAIDRWHDAFGLSEGIRPSLPRNDLRFVYARDGVEQYRRDRSTSGAGDLHGAAVVRLLGAGRPEEPRLRLDFTADIDLPTGDSDRLTGNDGTDLAAGLRLGSASASRLAWMLGAGLLWPGDIDLALPPASGRVMYYELALAWSATPGIDLLLGLDGHGGLYESRLAPLGKSALQLGAGALWRLGPRYGLRLGVFEDLRTDTAPDFAVELALLVQAVP